MYDVCLEAEGVEALGMNRGVRCLGFTFKKIY